MIASPLSGSRCVRLRERTNAELIEDILPFWEKHGFDESGWIVGSVGDDLTVDDGVPRHSVIVSRVLWTFAAAARAETDHRRRTRWLASGGKAWKALTGACWDDEFGGVFWSVTPEGGALSDRKQVYAQAFAIYGLVEWHEASGSVEAMERALALFDLMEQHSRDRRFGGYLEAHGRTWDSLQDMALSPRDLNVPKSMNTNLHVLEAFTSLLKATGNERVREALGHVLEVSLDKIVSFDPWAHCQLFFDMNWTSQTPNISWGHDIEASWLLWEAAVAFGDSALIARTRETALALADAVLGHGVDEDGAVRYEGTPDKVLEPEKHWWPQAEAVVGFLNAYELTGETRYRDAAIAAWDFIEDKVIDREHGEWFAILGADGNRLPATPGSGKIGPWKCPYHNGRACLEVNRRVRAGE